MALKCVDCIDESVRSAYKSDRTNAVIYPTDTADTISDGNALCIEHLKLRKSLDSNRTAWWASIRNIEIRRT